MMVVFTFVTLVTLLGAVLAAVVGFGWWPSGPQPRDRDQRAVDEELARPRPRGMSEP